MGMPSLPFGGARLLFHAAVLLIALSEISTVSSARFGPAPAPAPGPSSSWAAAPTPATVVSCDCNPSFMATNGTCTPLRLPTPWSCDVDPNDPLPDYPRPQLVRQDWHSLNGIWEWTASPTWESGPPPFNSTLPHHIVVPFPMQSDLSGLQAKDVHGVSRMWYRRTFTVPTSWAAAGANATLLNFGAVDWEAEVWVNRVRLGEHRGGYDKFSFDVTEALAKNPSGVHELIVRVFDPTEFAHIALGKQRLMARDQPGIFYTGSSGIWQTVWLEPVAPQHITRLDMVPDIDVGSLRITVQGSPSAIGLPVIIQIGKNSTKLATGQGVVGTSLNVSLPNARLWSPQDPYLYTVYANLYSSASNQSVLGASGEQAMLDQVQGYAGMRKIATCQTSQDGPLRICLNNEAILQIGLLDQGFWPDGLYTAPTDAALQADMDLALSLNFTTLRKHIKVEPDRWYYHADRKGVLVWQDMPAMSHEDPFTADNGYTGYLRGEKRQFEQEMKRMVEEHFSNPSIIQYVTFNEGWGQFETQRIVQQAHNWDPSRLMDAASGWVDPQDATSTPSNKPYDHYPGYVGDVRDDHNYIHVMSSGATETRASVAGEFGGLGLFMPGHTWIGGVGDAFGAYQIMANSSQLEDAFVGLIGDCQKLFGDPSHALSAAIYTEVSDVEDELNGLITYDRQVPKFGDPERVRQAISDALSVPI